MAVMQHLTVGGVTYDTVGEASVTQVQSSGTKIATVSIDGTSTDLYAPSGGSSVTPYASNPAMDGTASAGSSDDYARGDHVHPTDTSRAASTHAHGNITSGGDITATAPTIASGDCLVINDDSASKVTNGPAFGSSTTTFLRNDGTWAAPATGSAVSYQEYGFGNVSTGKLTIDGTDYEIWAYSQPSKATSAPLMDGTAAIGNSDKYAAENHVHPTDTSRAAASHSHAISDVTNLQTTLDGKAASTHSHAIGDLPTGTTSSTVALGNHTHSGYQATLVSGTNIKTVNGNSLLGSGNISTAELPSVSSSDNGKVLRVVSGEWAAASLPSASGVSF